MTHTHLMKYFDKMFTLKTIVIIISAILLCLLFLYYVYFDIPGFIEAKKLHKYRKIKGLLNEICSELQKEGLSLPEGNIYSFYSLTTPVSYISPFFKGLVYELELEDSLEFYINEDLIVGIAPGPDKRITTTLYHIHSLKKGESLLVSEIYDPTNGLHSFGDIICIKHRGTE